MEKKNYTIRISPQLHNYITVEAAKAGKRFSAFCEEMIVSKLDYIQPETVLQMEPTPSVNEQELY